MPVSDTIPDSMQLADELPMIYTVCIMGYATFSYKKSILNRVLVAAAMASIAGGITVRAPVQPHTLQYKMCPDRGLAGQAYYLYAKDPVFHQVAYGLLTVTTIFRGMYIMEFRLRPALQKRNPEEADEIMTTMWHLALTGTWDWWRLPSRH